MEESLFKAWLSSTFDSIYADLINSWKNSIMWVHFAHELIQFGLLACLLKEFRSVIIEERKNEEGLEYGKAYGDSEHNSPVLFDNKVVLD